MIAQYEPDGQGSVTEAYLLADGHGSTRLLTDAAAAIAAVYAYDAWGVSIGTDSDATLSTTLLYSGEQTDALTGLQYLRARYYDAATGRFNRRDPYAGNHHDPQSLHKYAYCHGDPVNGVDPTGRFLLLDILATAGIRGALVGFFGVGIAARFAGASWQDSLRYAIRGAVVGGALGVAFATGGIHGAVKAVTAGVFQGVASVIGRWLVYDTVHRRQMSKAEAWETFFDGCVSGIARVGYTAGLADKLEGIYDPTSAFSYTALNGLLGGTVGFASTFIREWDGSEDSFWPALGEGVGNFILNGVLGCFAAGTAHVAAEEFGIAVKDLLGEMIGDAIGLLFAGAGEGLRS